ncbi:hypothetical protein HBA54_04315 [Pelagibius litoralis]|uniref:Uncharacterized protein n=1 Tax=Pelagibius litoralis TaxID=374515 RepID=A0A967C7J2_9PROT|nr:hypothetical protein [Pelagibius litoralis]NIA67807.1 hypothetical protein [Pelagibius litoralis]
MTHTVKVKAHPLSDGSHVYQVMIIGPIEEDNRRRVVSFEATSEEGASDMADTFVDAINGHSLQSADVVWDPA